MNFSGIESSRNEANVLQPKVLSIEKSNHEIADEGTGVICSMKRRNDEECNPTTSSKRLKKEIESENAKDDGGIVSSIHEDAKIANCGTHQPSTLSSNASMKIESDSSASSCVPDTTCSLTSFSSFSPSSSSSSTVLDSPPSYTEALRNLYGTGAPKNSDSQDEKSA